MELNDGITTKVWVPGTPDLSESEWQDRALEILAAKLARLEKGESA